MSEVVLDDTLKDGEYKFYEDLGNGYCETIGGGIAIGKIGEISTNKVFIGDNEITDYDSFMKVATENNQLQQENKELKENRDKAIEYINKEENMKLFNGVFGYGEFIGTLEEILGGDK